VSRAPAVRPALEVSWTGRLAWDPEEGTPGPAAAAVQGTPWLLTFDHRRWRSEGGDRSQVMGSATAHSPRQTLYRELPAPRTLDPRHLMRVRERN